MVLLKFIAQTLYIAKMQIAQATKWVLANAIGATYRLVLFIFESCDAQSVKKWL